jgi:hypothetical protein
MRRGQCTTKNREEGRKMSLKNKEAFSVREIKKGGRKRKCKLISI